MLLLILFKLVVGLVRMIRVQMSIVVIGKTIRERGNRLLELEFLLYFFRIFRFGESLNFAEEKQCIGEHGWVEV